MNNQQQQQHQHVLHHHHINQQPQQPQQQQQQQVSTSQKISLHDIFETSHGDVFIVSSLSTKKDTQIIRIEGRCGMLLFEGLPGVDIFPNHRQAVAYLKKKHTLKSNIRVFAILGYIISERSSHLLVATKIRNEGELLGSYSVNTIIETSWIKIDLSYLSSYQSNEIQSEEGWATTLVDDSNIDSSIPSSSSSSSNTNTNNTGNNNNSSNGGSGLFSSFISPSSSSSSSSSSNNNNNNNNNTNTNTSNNSTTNNNNTTNNESSNSNNGTNTQSSNDPTLSAMLKDLQTFPLDGTHFYCETYDLTNYFPSSNTTPFQYCSEFTWNEWMRKPFENAQLSHLCVVLLQGYASIKSIPNLNVSISYIMKRSKLNPGTHFFSPGINENASPANEYESEIIMWKVQDRFTLPILSSSSSSSSSVTSPLDNNGNLVDLENNKVDSSTTSNVLPTSTTTATSTPLTSTPLTSTTSNIDKMNPMNLINNSGNDKIIKWTSHVWRRGTVPLWWRAFSKNQGSNEIELFLKDRGKENPNPFEKSEIYYQNLLNRYQSFYQNNKSTNLSGIPSIQLINLLKQENDKQELILSQLYQKSCENVTSFLTVDLQMYTFDWTNNLKLNNNSLSKTVSNLWDSIKSSLDNSGFSQGIVKPFDNNQLINQSINSSSNNNQHQQHNNNIISTPSPSLSSSSFLPMISSPFIKNSVGNNMSIPSPSPLLNSMGISSGGYSSLNDSNSAYGSSYSPSPQLISNSNNNNLNGNNSIQQSNNLTTGTIEKRFIHLNYQPQKEIIRYSCLDSLERVNIVLFFNFFQIVSKMGSELGIPSLNELLSFGSSSLEFMLSTFKQLKLYGPLIEFYISSSDITSILYHNNPSIPNPIMKELVQQFSTSNNNNANNNTNNNSNINTSNTSNTTNSTTSNTTNSSTNSNTTNTNSTSGGILTTSHLLNSQRKYQSNHSDENRSYQYLLMLGNCFGFSSRFFPFNSSIGKDLSPYWISSAPSSCVMSLPTLLNNGGSCLNPSILIRDIDDFCWIFPNDTKSIEMVIYLCQPCVVTELCITVAHGINSDSFPKTMDVLVGNYLDQQTYVLQDIELPRCTTGTKLSYILPLSPWEAYSSRFNQNNNLGGGRVSLDRYFNRIVKIQFSGNHTPLTIGKIEIFGYHSNSYFNNNNSLMLNINPTYRNSLGSSSAGNSYNYNQLITNDIYHQMEKTKKKQQQQQSNNLNSISDTFINYQIDNILNLLNNNNSSSEGLKSPYGSNSKNNSFNDYHSILKQQQKQQTQLPIEMISQHHKSSLDSPTISSEQQDDILLINDYNESSGNSNGNNSNGSSNNVSNNGSVNSFDNSIGSGIGGIGSGIEKIQLNNLIKKSSYQENLKTYESLIVAAAQSNDAITLLETLELENKRIQFSISPCDRDNIFKRLSINSNLLNPDRFIFERDEKIEVNIRKSSKYKSSVCQRPSCGKPLAFLDKIRHQQCSYCYKRFCPACVSSNQVKIFEFESSKPISVCYTCAILIGKQEQLFKKIQNADKQYYTKKSKFVPSFYQKVLLDLHFNQNNTNTNTNNLSALPSSFETISETLSPLAEYPKGGIINHVETASDSPPIESILLAPTILPLNMYWKAPTSVNSVDIGIMLSYESLVYSISLIVDSIGYHNYDLPIISISSGKTFTSANEYQEIGEWILHPNGWSSNHDPNLVIQPQSCVSYILPKPIQARIISLKFTLPLIPKFLNNNNGIGSGVGVSGSGGVSGNGINSNINNGIGGNNNGSNDISLPQIHIGRIAVHGGFSDSLSDISTWSSSSLPLSTFDKDLHENTLYSTSFIGAPKRNPMKTNIQIKSNKSIHISLANNQIGTNIRGFSLIITHDENEGVKSQVKGISISFYSLNQKNELSSHQYLTQILVPKCRQSSTLYFDFPIPLPSSYILSFEFISNYGGKLNSFPKVNLY